MEKKPPVATPEMLNSIRAEATAEYQAKVPEATASNLLDVGNPILNYEAVGNEFVNALINKIVYTIVIRQMWENPLAILRRDEMPLGFDVEEVHTNPAAAVKYDGTETGMADLLKMHKPDVASAYHRINRQDKYPVTINNEQLTHAFTSWARLENFIAGIVDSLYNGNAIDEFKYTKQLISSAFAANYLQTVQLPAPVDAATGKAFLAKLRGLSTMFTYPSSNFNSYKLMGGTGNPRQSWAPIDRQIILITGEAATNIGVDVLSTLFNVQYADYLARQIILDQFDEAGRIQAIIADERVFMIMSQLRQFRTFYNASSLGWQYYFHAWDMFSMSPFFNCVALVTPA